MTYKTPFVAGLTAASTPMLSNGVLAVTEVSVSNIVQLTWFLQNGVSFDSYTVNWGNVTQNSKPFSTLYFFPSIIMNF